MTTSDRDQLIRTALAPRADLAVPPDLGGLIHAQLLETPQRRRPPAAPVLRRLPEMPLLARPAAIWLTALLLLILAVLGIVAIGARPETPFPVAVTTYHGGPAQDGTMPGPGPAGVAVIAHDVQLPGPLDNLSATLVRDGIVFAADLRGHVSALAASDLATVWRVDDLSPGAHAPVLLGSTLIVAGDDGSVVALDAATGERRWPSPVRLDLDVSAPLAGAGDVVLVSSGEGMVVALSAADGHELYRVDAGGPVKRSPAIADGRVYAAADTGIVTAFDLETGAVAWQIDLAADDRAPLSQPEVSSPAYADGVLYLARGPFDVSSPHEIVAIDVATQAVRWRSPSPTLDRMFVGAVTADAVYSVGEDGAIRILDLDTGQPRQIAAADAGIGALATFVGDTLYVASYDGIVRAIDRHTGVEAWRVQVDGMPTQPVVIDGRVYVGTTLGRAVAIGAP